jgi:protein-tyrosine-phosphatase
MSTILFICEHGSAKSVVAASHFNKRAEALGLECRAVSRGTDPDQEVHPAAVAGLAADGLRPRTSPIRLEQADMNAAERVIAFSELPPPYQARNDTEIWSVPPVSENYERARDAIIAHIERLVRDLSRET